MSYIHLYSHLHFMSTIIEKWKTNLHSDRQLQLCMERAPVVQTNVGTNHICYLLKSEWVNLKPA